MRSAGLVFRSLAPSPSCDAPLLTDPGPYMPSAKGPEPQCSFIAPAIRYGRILLTGKSRPREHRNRATGSRSPKWTEPADPLFLRTRSEYSSATVSARVSNLLVLVTPQPMTVGRGVTTHMGSGLLGTLPLPIDACFPTFLKPSSAAAPPASGIADMHPASLGENTGARKRAKREV